MNFKILISFIYVISTLYIPTAAYGAGDEGDQCKQRAEQIKNKCQELMGDVAERGQVRRALGEGASGAAGIEGDAQILRDVATDQLGDINLTSGACAELKAQCTKDCQQKVNEFIQLVQGKQSPYFNPGQPPMPNMSLINDQKQKLIDGLQGICGQDMGNQLAELGLEGQNMGDTAGGSELTRLKSEQGDKGGGGMSPMMAGLLGAALGAGAAMLWNKKKEDDKKKEEEEEKDEDVVNEDGVVDCTKAGAEAYSDCNEYFVSKCEESLDSAECKNFSARYCTSGSATDTSDEEETVPATSDSGIFIASAEDKDIKGEGVGTQFCFTSLATNFCATAGREACPSCLQLETNKAEACKSNPALCLAQNNPAEIEAAKNSCPSDPMFSNPDYIAGGGATVPESDSLSDPILPENYASSSDSSIIGGEASDTAGGYASGGSASDVAGEGDDSVSSNGSGSGSGGGIGFSGSGSASDVAGGELSDPILPSSMSVASASRSPTSAGGAMGPSLFSMSSAMIESRCKRRQLAHCSR